MAQRSGSIKGQSRKTITRAEYLVKVVSKSKVNGDTLKLEGEGLIRQIES